MTKTLSVTSARQQLLKLTKDLGRRMDQVVLTNKGEAQAILMSMGEYNSLRAAAELLSHPEARRASDEGFEQLRRGEGISLENALPVASGKVDTAPAVHIALEAAPKPRTLTSQEVKPALRANPLSQSGRGREFFEKVEPMTRRQPMAPKPRSGRRSNAAASRSSSRNTG